MKFQTALVTIISALSYTDAFTLAPSSRLMSSSSSQVTFHVPYTSSNTRLFAEEGESQEEAPAEEGEGAAAENEGEEETPAVAAADDILNSPAFLKRKLDVLKSDIAAAEEKLEEANKIYEANKAENGEQIQNLRKEYENISNRLDAQSKAGGAGATREVATELLSVLDNYDRAFGVIEAETEEEKAVEASYMKVKSMILDTLSDLGVKSIETIGMEFNYEFHQAVMQRMDENYEEGYVCDELAKGYAMEDGTLIRAAMVVVAA